MTTVRDVEYEADGLTMVGSLGIPDEPGRWRAMLELSEEVFLA
jgi:hypothetical protein